MIITEMPEPVLDKIIEFSDFKAVLTLRQVCRDFLNFIDDLNDSKLPDSKLLTFGIRSDYTENNVIVCFMGPDDSFYRFVYSEVEKSRSFNGKTTNLKDEDIVDVAIRDLERILKFQKSTFQWSCFNIHQLFRRPKFPNLEVKLSNMFRKLNRKIKTEILDIMAYSQVGFMSILPFVDPETLKRLRLFSMNKTVRIEMNEIAETEQWKNAKSIYCYFYALKVTVDDICHFSNVFIKMLYISARVLDFLRETITSCSNIDFSRFKFEIPNENEEMSNLWGHAFITAYLGFTNYSWYFRMKNSKEKILLAEIRPTRTKTNICFENIESREVPNGAIVHDFKGNTILLW
ncbi:hypothetical protein B9Z55_021287 [Caenorhabditis nigoni]|uniref:F-box domain-containing protein n=1 Tax=Caenorhabditis nigoni TaxID=1611254 RepID=A0A2G5TRG5_9PELO|nr:hypothetical protein B9Z55_021287 [Caenorhabditis nigoni]